MGLGEAQIMVRSAYGTAAEKWRERMARWQCSGFSVSEFCRREGVGQPAFYQWRKKLRQNRGPRRSRGRTPVFLPVEVVNGTTAAASMTAAQGESAGNSVGGLVELVLPRGVIVRVGAQIDELQLRTVLRAVIAETSGC
jgi:transposase-like protein